MDSFKSLIIALALVALFSYTLLSFGYGLQRENDLNTTILDDSSLSQLNSSIRSNLGEFESSQKGYTNATLSEQGDDVQPTGDLSVSSVFHTITTFGGFIFGMGGALLSPSLLSKIGIDATISAVLISILAIIVVLVIWRLRKIGQ